MEYFLGTIELFPYTFAPMDWNYCDGSTLSIQQYSSLFALIGTSYGGDGINNFKVPNMLGLEPIPGMRFCICVAGLFPTRP